MYLRSIIVSLLLTFSISAIRLNAQPYGMHWSDLNDSLKRQLSLKSYVVVPARDLYANDLSAITNIALDFRDFDLNKISDVLAKIYPENIPIPVIGDSSILNFSLPAEVIGICCEQVNYFRLDSSATAKNEWPLFSPRQLLLLDTGNEMLSDSVLMSLWKSRGKMPNFIVHSTLDEAVRVTGFLNRQKKIFGLVSSGKGPLEEVLLKDLPGQVISGYFSLPITGAMILKPYKAGYQFSPDVIYNAPNNERNSKNFRAIPLEPEWGLTDYFQFRKKVKNLCRDNPDEIITQNIDFKYDSERGDVAFFNDAYIDAGISSKTILSGAFSISVWIKPDELGDNNSLLGKGSTFVIKIRRGKLTFTMAGIKDYISASSCVEAGKWTHVVVVYSHLEKIIRFYLNGKKTDEIKLIADYVGSDHSLLIGSNLWEEFFSGYMDDVRIWERELNEQEIEAEYLRVDSESRISAWYALLLIVLLPLFFFRKKIKTPVVQKLNTTVISGPQNKPENEIAGVKIFCFGGLRILCPDGTDISRKLSPKLKQLFVLILLHSGPGKKGISSKKMSELLWPGMSVANAKNTRGTNMQNLRQLLAPCSGLNIAFNDKLWSLEITGDFYCDYYRAEELFFQIEQADSSEHLQHLARQLSLVLKNGRFLPAVEVSWMDVYHEKFSSRVIEHCLGLPSRFAQRDLSLELELADIAGLYDELNETVLKLKVSILTLQGKHSLAEGVYKSYQKLYTELYGVEYPINFQQLIKYQN